MRTAIKYRDKILENFYLDDDRVTIKRLKDCVRSQFKKDDKVIPYKLSGNNGMIYGGIHIPGTRTTISLHWLIVVLRGHEIFENSVIDHLNGNTFDNSEENLRVVTQQVNSKNSKLRSDNTSGYVGLSFHKPTGRFVVRRTIAGKRIWRSAETFDKALIIWKELNSIALSDGYTQRHGK